MNRAEHSRFRHSHDFVSDFTKSERRTRIVIAITGVMMVVEITAGLLSHSMALLADGWHMSTHVTAFLITAIAYYFTRRHSSNEQFSFGTGKIGVLGGFASAIVLSVVALLMAGESTRRLFAPLTIHFNEAIGIACIGLLVNVGCAFLLSGALHESHDPSGAHHHDLNLRAAYLHVWQIGTGKFAAIVSIVAHEPRPSDYYRALFRDHDELVHVTIETQRCREDHESVASS